MNAAKSMKRMGSVLLTMAVLGITLPAKAQEIEAPVQQALNYQAKDYTVLHVDAAFGDDQQGSGSAAQPYGTITQALQMAPSATSTVILLAPGHYSQTSGEVFPLRLRPGVTIQGNTGETRNTVIVGSGEFRDDSAVHSATIITSDRSGLANIAVSNPKGSGIWITTGSPILRRVALVSNAVAGIQVTDSAPVIENSYFNRNQRGLAIRGNSRAVVRGNYFEATGQAITIASPATPTIHNNRIARNDVGIALKNNARPILQANVLNNNGRNGVVEVEPTTVTFLGRNGVVEVEPTTVTLPTVVAAPEPERLAASVAVSTVSNESVEAEGGPQERIDAEMAADETVFDDVESISAIASFRQHLATSSTPAPVTTSDLSETLLENSLEHSAVPIAVIPADDFEVVTNNNPSNNVRRDGISQLLARLNPHPTVTTPMTVAPTPSTNHGAIDSPIENSIGSPIGSPIDSPIDSPNVPIVEASSQRLPVPSAAIPSRSNSSGTLMPPGTLSLARTFRYRVLVNLKDAEDLQHLVPDAFRTRVENRMFMQAGAYVDEVEAQARLEWLQQHGIEGSINVRN